MRLDGFLLLAASALAYVTAGVLVARRFGGGWAERLSALLSRREPAVVLDSARVVVLLCWMRNVPDVPLVAENLRRRAPWVDPVGVFQWIDPFLVPPGAVPVLVWAFRAALLLGVVGVGARAALAAAAVLHALLWSIAYTTVGYSVHNHVVFFVLAGLALSPAPYAPLWRYAAAWRRGAPAESLGTHPAYLRWAAMFSMCTVYVQAGMEKLLTGGLPWFNGTTLAGHALRKDQLSTHLAGLPLGLLSVLAVAVVLWEAGFGLVLLFPRWRWAGVVTGVAFHETIRRGMGVTPFFFMQAGLLFLVTPYEAWRSVRARLGGRAEPARGDVPPAPVRARFAAALGALLFLSWVPTAVRRGVYPVAPNAMFSGALHDGRVISAGSHLLVRDAGGVQRELEPADALALHREAFDDLVFKRYLSPFRPYVPFRDTKDDYCRRFLDHLARYADPDAAALTITTDLFVVPAPEYETRRIWTCSRGPLGEQANRD